VYVSLFLGLVFFFAIWMMDGYNVLSGFLRRWNIAVQKKKASFGPR